MKTDMVKEELLNISKRISLMTILFTEIDDVGDYDYPYVVYLEGPQPLLITGYLFHAEGREVPLLRQGKGFKEILEAHSLAVLQIPCFSCIFFSAMILLTTALEIILSSVIF